jgi:hypothetical protein
VVRVKSCAVHSAAAATMPARKRRHMHMVHMQTPDRLHAAAAPVAVPVALANDASLHECAAAHYANAVVVVLHKQGGQQK